nr:MAG TPA: hypothetical protein [Caudoviricetes sp.]
MENRPVCCEHTRRQERVDALQFNVFPPPL